MNFPSSLIKDAVEAISNFPGIGKRTAERLAVELRNKLSEFQPDLTVLPSSKDVEDTDSQQISLEESKRRELRETLIGLGYEEVEIRRAIKAVTFQKQVTSSVKASDSIPSEQDPQALLRASLIWLSQEAA